MMESTEQKNHFKEESKQYEDDDDDDDDDEEEDDTDEQDVDEIGETNRITQNTNVNKVDLKKCTETHLGNKSVYHGPVKVRNYLQISVPDIKSTTSTSQPGGGNHPTGKIQPLEYAIVTTPELQTEHLLPFTAPAIIKTRHQNLENCDTQDTSNLIQSEEGITVNEETPLLADVNDENKFKGKYAIYSVTGILAALILVFLLIYELILYYKDPSNEDNLPMNFTERLVTRGEWFALEPKQDMPAFNYKPTPFIVVCHTATSQCDNRETCRSMVRYIQAMQMDDVYFDIAYNYLVAGDGYIYEGRGWDEASAGTTVMDCSALSVGFIGNFITDLPQKKQLDAFKLILDYGVEIGKLDENFKMFMQGQIKNTESPGAKLIDILIKWPHWRPFDKQDLLCNSTMQKL